MSAGFSASLPAFLPVSVCLLASLPVCRRFCRSLSACWSLCQSAGVSAGFCLPAGLSASLPAFLPVSVCLLACDGFCVCLIAFVLCCLRFGLPGEADSLLFVCWRLVFFCWWLHCCLLLICAAFTFSLSVFCCPAFSSVVHVDILIF